MKILFTIAFRNLLRNRRRTVITMLALVVGLSSLTFLRAFMYGAQRQMVSNITSMLTGDIQIIPDAQRNIYNTGGAIEDPIAVETILKNNPEVEAFAEEIVGGGLISAKQEALATYIVGINPDQEAQLGTRINIIAGRSLTLSDHRSVILGELLRKNLGVAIGDTVAITAQDYYGSMTGDVFTIIGSVESGNEQLDAANVIMLLSTAQPFLSFDHRLSKLVIKTKTDRPLSAVAKDLQNKIHNPALAVMTWEELIPMMAQMIQFQNGMIFVVMMIILIVAVVGIVNTLLMSVMERIPEFGLLVAIGTRPWQIVGIVLLEALMITAAGAAAGVGLGWYLTLITARHGIDLSLFTKALSNLLIGSQIHPVMDWSYTAIFVAVILLGVMLAAIGPASRAGRVSPLTAMRDVG